MHSTEIDQQIGKPLLSSSRFGYSYILIKHRNQRRISCLAMEDLAAAGGSTSYYSVLGVGADSSTEEIRRAYRKLALEWHPDRWTRNPDAVPGKAKRKFQQIQEAYSVLSDKRKRSLYDAGLYHDPDQDEEEVEGFCDFLQEMLNLMAQTRKEEKKEYGSMEELQRMFREMVQGFDEMQDEKTTRMTAAATMRSATFSSDLGGGGGHSHRRRRRRRDSNSPINAAPDHFQQLYGAAAPAAGYCH